MLFLYLVCRLLRICCLPGHKNFTVLKLFGACDNKHFDFWLCDFCPLSGLWSFMHMYWECPDVVQFWKQIPLTLSDMLEVRIPISPTLLPLNGTDPLNCLCIRDISSGLVSCGQDADLEMTTATFLGLAAVGQLSAQYSLDGDRCLLHYSTPTFRGSISY